MLGDKIVVKPHHTKAAEGVYERIKNKIVGSEARKAITVAGESGSGKSEIASEIARLFKERHGIESVMLHQDDYFVRPPKTNDRARREDINKVGMQEVKMELLNEHIKEVKDGKTEKLVKPLIDYDNDALLEETAEVSSAKIVVAEGTYTTALDSADIHVFIDRTWEDTVEHRKERGRDELDEYTEKILRIEHKIISSHRKKADVIITKNYGVENS